MFDERVTAVEQNISLVSSVGAEFVHKVYLRLVALGYTATPEDDFLIGFTIISVENDIKSACNVSALPEGVENLAVDRVCGKILLEKKQSGRLTGFDLDMAVKSIGEGDTSVSFAADESVDKKLDVLINYLLSHSVLSAYRRIKW